MKSEIAVLMFGLGSVCAGSATVVEQQEADFKSMRLNGYAGERLRGCELNQMAAKDVVRLAFPFTQKTEKGVWDVVEPGIWQTEFWGKYMHAAVPMAEHLGDAAFKARLGASVQVLLDHQLADGYIGNYRPETRGDCCDVWGCKYVMMGLLHWYDATGDKRTLEGTRKLADWVIAHFGPGKRSLGAEGPFNGLMNCSVLEPIVWLYRRTGDGKYLDFARWIVTELDTNAKGPEVFRFASAKTPLKDCKTDLSGNKAYEKMSCCQGLLDYYVETGDRRAFDCVRTIAEQAVAEEFDLSGGGTQGERFCGFKALQTENRTIASEMCVIITWMRLCEKLLVLTDDPKWADELERTFYNAYLGGLSADGAVFASYGGLGGIRERIHPEQCRMHANCCDSNGARGFLSFLKSAATSRGEVVSVNQYVYGLVRVPCAAAKGGYVLLDQFNDYPRKLTTSITLALDAPATFTLRLRTPAWSDETKAQCSFGEPIVKKGPGYIEIRRTFQPGDQVKLTFDAKVKKHLLNNHVAFTRGPVLLARDARFHDGDFSEAMALEDQDATFVDSLPPEAGMYLATTGLITMGVHYNHPPRPIGFCDFASAGNTDDGRSFYRVWFPLRK